MDGIRAAAWGYLRLVCGQVSGIASVVCFVHLCDRTERGTEQARPWRGALASASFEQEHSCVGLREEKELGRHI